MFTLTGDLLTPGFNYFNYFTEIEERFQQRRGALLLLSTLDWALIETWREAGIPLDAVLRGIDAAFDKYEARQKKARMRKINGLAWCAQAVMEAAEELREAAAGTANPTTEPRESGFEHDRIAAHLEAAAAALDAATVAPEACAATATRLRQLAAAVRGETNAAGKEFPHQPKTLPRRATTSPPPKISKTSNATSPSSKRSFSPPSPPPRRKICWSA